MNDGTGGRENQYNYFPPRSKLVRHFKCFMVSKLCWVDGERTNRMTIDVSTEYE